MVWPFSRKKVIDLTDKNLVFMNSQKPVSARNLSAEEYADLTKANPSFSSNQSTSATSTDTSDTSGVSAFGDFFSAASESSSSLSSSSSSLEIQGLKNKFEDLEYKMDNVMRKLNALLDRFEVVEKKVGRGMF